METTFFFYVTYIIKNRKVVLKNHRIQNKKTYIKKKKKTERRA